MLTKYIAATLTYAAAAIAIAEKAVSNGRIDPTKISALWWMAIFVATLGYVFVLVETRRTTRELTKQKLQRAAVKGLADARMRRAIDVLLRPYKLFLKGVVPVDAWDRLDNDAGYVLQILGEPGARSAFRSIDARADANVYPKCTNWELLADRSREARDVLGQLVANFSSYFGPEVLATAETLRADEMVGMRLPDLGDLVAANQELPTYTLEHALGGLGDYAAFDTMIVRTRALLDAIRLDTKTA